MTEVIASYQDLIDEAFIKPIRTVTVIDDEYPTLHRLIDSRINNVEINNIDEQNMARLNKIIAMCHNQRNWSLDVFDGQNPAVGNDDYIPNYLNHSDLLILDYHLDGEPTSGDGERARSIISKLDENNHFNIILVHTKGINDGDIKKVFEEILLTVNPVRLDYVIDAETESKVDDWIDDNDEDLSFTWLKQNYPILDLLKIVECKNKKVALNPRNPRHLFYQNRDEINKIATASGVGVDALIQWKIISQFKFHAVNLCSNTRSDLRWDWSDNGVNFIATGKVFISVVRKDSNFESETLYESLRKAFHVFNASPMHLLMAKIRHEIDERGLEQAQEIVSNQYAQAGWLYNLLNRSDDLSEHDKAIDLHWEQLGRSSKATLSDFSRRLINATRELDGGDIKSTLKRFFRMCINDVDLSCGHLNAFTCSMPVVSSHLNTGSIFTLGDEYWICLTPACDLVPEQKVKQWEARIGNKHMAFKAVRLVVVNLSTANNRANSNEYIYLAVEKDSEPLVFSFAEGDGSPIWDIFYAKDMGRFSETHEIDLECVRRLSDNLSIQHIKAKVIAELRYEYALNLLHRLGANQSRVGLDFIDKKSLWS